MIYDVCAGVLRKTSLMHLVVLHVFQFLVAQLNHQSLVALEVLEGLVGLEVQVAHLRYHQLLEVLEVLAAHLHQWHQEDLETLVVLGGLLYLLAVEVGQLTVHYQ